MFKRIFSFIFISFIFNSLVLALPRGVVVFDTGHAQTAGNADWVPNGAYSDFAKLIAGKFSLSFTSAEKITDKVLKKAKILVLAEPNSVYATSELEAMRKFYKKGGKFILIGDHIRSDRNNDGIDSVGVLNKLLAYLQIPLRCNKDNILTQQVKVLPPFNWHVRKVAYWAGCSISILNKKNVKKVLAYKGKTLAAIYKKQIFLIGDSSLFDDGTASKRGKKVHGGFHSLVYSHEQFIINVLTYMFDLDKKILLDVEKKREKLFDLTNLSKKNIFYDVAHNNKGPEHTRDFVKILQGRGFTVKFVDDFENLKNLKLKDKKIWLIILNPKSKFSSEELKILKKELTNNNFYLILAINSAKNCNIEVNKILDYLNVKERFSSLGLNKKWPRKRGYPRSWQFMVNNVNLWKPTYIYNCGNCLLNVKKEKDIYLHPKSKIKQKDKLDNYCVICKNKNIFMVGFNPFSDFAIAESQLYRQVSKNFEKVKEFSNNKTLEFLLENIFK